MKFMNEIPVSGHWAALRLMIRSWGDRTERFLQVWSGEKPHIEVAIYTGPYDSHSLSRCWSVTTAIADWMRGEGYVIGEPHWGYRSTQTFVPTRLCEEVFWGSAGLICRGGSRVMIPRGGPSGDLVEA